MAGNEDWHEDKRRRLATRTMRLTRKSWLRKAVRADGDGRQAARASEKGLRGGLARRAGEEGGKDGDIRLHCGDTRLRRWKDDEGRLAKKAGDGRLAARAGEEGWRGELARTAERKAGEDSDTMKKAGVETDKSEKDGDARRWRGKKGE